MLLIHDYFVSNQPGEEGGRVAGRVGSGTAWVGSGQIIGSWSRVGSGPDPGGSGRVRKIGPGNNSGISGKLAWSGYVHV